jgi:hypothetical protein
MFVEELPGLEAVMQLAEHAVEQVPLGLGVPVSVLASAPVVGFGARRGGQGGERPEEACGDEPVVLDEAALPELLAVTDFRATRPEPLFAENDANGGETYPAPAPQFSLTRYQLGAGDRCVVPEPGPGVVLCLENEVAVRRDQAVVALTAGQAAFVPHEGGPAELTGAGLAFHATPGVPAT